MKMKKKKLELLGFILTLIGFLPVIIWGINLIRSRATDTRILFAGVPATCIGMYLIDRSRVYDDSKA